MRIVNVLIALAFILCLVGCPKEPDNEIFSVVFRKADNPGLTSDVTANIAGFDITATIDLFCPLSALKPTIEASPGATISPASGVAQDFRGPYGVSYTVTGESGVEAHYSIQVYNGHATIVAGQLSTPGATDATGTSARFKNPFGVAYKGGSLYITDTDNYRIRRMVISSAAVTTVAGTGSSGSADGNGTSASFGRMRQIFTDGTDFYIADYDNAGIRKMTAAYDVTTIGSGLTFAAGVATDGATLYVGYHQYIGKMPIGGDAVTPMVDLGTSSLTTGLVLDGSSLYATDWNRHVIYKVNTTNNTYTVFAGKLDEQGQQDGVGAAATFNVPAGIVKVGSYLYVADYGNSTIRRIDLSTAEVASLKIPYGVELLSPSGIAWDGANLYTVNGTSVVTKIY